MSDINDRDQLHDVVCPFCGLVCDDLSPTLRSGVVEPERIICAKARTGFAAATAHHARQPAINGADTTLESALERAVELISGATLPLISGLIGDLSDSHAALALAEHCGGVLDHCDGDRIATTLQVYQETGWLSTSLGELRNRADLIITLGNDLEASYPRWREKILDVGDRLHVDQAPQQLHLAEDLLAVLGEARAAYKHKPVATLRPSAESLVAKLRKANYPVFVVGDLPGADTDLILRSVAGLVRDINQEARASLLVLGDNNGGTSAQLTAASQNGFGIRTSFATGSPIQNWSRYASQRLLSEHETDVLIWICSLQAIPPPNTDIPTIVFGHPGLTFDTKPAVYCPVSVPGTNRPGFIHRGDGLRLIALRALTSSDLPSTKMLTEHLMCKLSRSRA